MITLEQAHALLPGSELVGDPATWIERVHSDSRSVQAGDLFVALRGERFDGHDYLAQARASGAVAALAEHGIREAGLSGLQVPDSTVALGQLAAAWRQRFRIPVIAVAGSNGKTTVTQMIGCILHACVGPGALVTRGNLNNHLGVPLTLLRMRQDVKLWHRGAVVELGMNHPGEIAGLAEMTAPTVALVNNAQREHQEFMASVEAVARENGSVFAALGSTGVAVFPADDPHALLWRELAGPRPVMTFAYGLPGDADMQIPQPLSPPNVYGEAAWVTDHWVVQLRCPAGALVVAVHAPGMHNVRNALAAVACTLAAGVPINAIREGLAKFRPVTGRSQVHRLSLAGRQCVLVDDSYNANPDSVRAAIEVLADLPQPRWLVLGDMGEVGERGPAFHAEVGTLAARHGIEHLWTVGEASVQAAQAFGDTARHHMTVEAMLAELPKAPAFASVLIKGSRFMHMERMVQALLQAADAQALSLNEGHKHAG